MPQPATDIKSALIAIGLALNAVWAIAQAENGNVLIKVGEKFVYGVVDREGRITGPEGMGKMVLMAPVESDIGRLVRFVKVRDIDGWTKMMVSKQAIALIDGARLEVLEVNSDYVTCSVTMSGPGLPPKVFVAFVPQIYFLKDEYKLIKR